MNKKQLPGKVVTNPHVFLSRIKTRWPLLIWLVAVFLTVFIYFHGGRFGGMSGSVITSLDHATPLETGRLKSIFVQIGDSVLKEAPLAQMDTSLLLAEKAVFEAEVRSMHGELKAVSSEVERLNKLRDQQLTSEQNILALRVKQKTLEAEITASEVEKQISLLEMRIQNCTLRAQADGVVSRIYHSPGSVIQSGDPVLISVIKEAPSVVGFLSELNARDVVPGMQAYLTPVSGRGTVIPAKVVSLTPDIFSLPNRANPAPSRTYRGRRVLIEPAAGSALLPGEEVQIHFSRPWTFQAFGNLFNKGADS